MDIHCALDVRSTIEDLHAYMRRYGREVLAERYAPIRVTVNGFNDDPRELWEIPQVVELCQRVIDSGLLSLLSCDPDPRLYGWSAIQVCGCAFGFYSKYRGDSPGVASFLDLSGGRIDRLKKAISDSNLVCDGVLAPEEA